MDFLCNISRKLLTIKNRLRCEEGNSKNLTGACRILKQFSVNLTRYIKVLLINKNNNYNGKSSKNITFQT